MSKSLLKVLNVPRHLHQQQMHVKQAYSSRSRHLRLIVNKRGNKRTEINSKANFKCLRSPVGLLGTMITGDASCRSRDSKQNSFLALILLLPIFFTGNFIFLNSAISEKSLTSLEEVPETGRNTERSDISLDNNTTLNETDSKMNGLYSKQSKHKSPRRELGVLRNSASDGYVFRFLFLLLLTSFLFNFRLMQLHLGQQNSFKEAESVKFTKSNLDTETSADEVKPLRNMSEESELSRSVMASASSEKEDEDGSQRKKSLIKKRRHYRSAF
ncbi:unnamed protein product [Wuchereria bancrofti]|uniref:Transmembrane protein n=1 Tax=Wuchereria bancrofti TaxID=6293 RepID=A0A3P7EEG5_WUCBA|nr:unnamed protein product [Wuchereria bancrofti]